jgi:hypothetical protein
MKRKDFNSTSQHFILLNMTRTQYLKTNFTLVPVKSPGISVQILPDTGGSRLKILATQKAEIRRISLKPAWANSLQDPVLKITNTKRAGGVAHVVECLPSNPEALSSKPSTVKKKKKKHSDF